MAISGVSDPSLTSSGLPPDEVLDALTAGVVRIRRRAEIYESDSTTKFDIPYWDQRLVEGTVTVDRERDERRMCDLTLDNGDGLLKHDPYNGFWFDKIIKVFWGIKYYDQLGNTKLWEVQIGEFMIDRIDENRFPDLVKVTGRDYAKKCLTSKIQYSLSFPSFTPIEQIIQAVAANAGVTKFNLPITGQVYNRSIVFERGLERWKVLQQVADTIGYEVFFQGDGKLTMQRYPDPTYDPVAWEFTQGSPDGTLVEYKRSSNDSRIFNHIFVVGATTTVNDISTTVFSEKRNDDPGSPTRISRIGDRVMPPVQSDYITDQTQADNLAAQLLAVNSLEEYSIDFSSVILPWLDAGDIITVEDDAATDFTPKRFLFSNFTIPLGLGAMTGNARRVTMVGSRQTWEFV
jgi:hypothetical protein